MHAEGKDWRTKTKIEEGIRPFGVGIVRPSLKKKNIKTPEE